MTLAGSVVSLQIASGAGADMRAMTELLAVAGRGFEGDRYFKQTGTYSHYPGTGRAVTLIEIEAIEALAREYDVQLSPGSARRNLVTRGVALNHLVGTNFAVGAVVLRGMHLCEPCLHLGKLTVEGAVRGLVHRGGLRAEIVVGGVIRMGDPITVID